MCFFRRNWPINLLLHCSSQRCINYNFNALIFIHNAGFLLVLGVYSLFCVQHCRREQFITAGSAYHQMGLLWILSGMKQRSTYVIHFQERYQWNVYQLKHSVGDHFVTQQIELQCLLLLFTLLPIRIKSTQSLTLLHQMIVSLSPFKVLPCFHAFVCLFSVLCINWLSLSV